MSEADSFRGIHRNGTPEAFEVHLVDRGKIEELGWYSRSVNENWPSPLFLGDGPYHSAEGAYLATAGGEK